MSGIELRTLKAGVIRPEADEADGIIAKINKWLCNKYGHKWKVISKKKVFHVPSGVCKKGYWTARIEGICKRCDLHITTREMIADFFTDIELLNNEAMVKG